MLLHKPKQLCNNLSGLPFITQMTSMWGNGSTLDSFQMFVAKLGLFWYVERGNKMRKGL